MIANYERLSDFILDTYDERPVPLHRPIFDETEVIFSKEAIDSNFVSSVGPIVQEFEANLSQFTGVNHVIAVVNGTSALHLSLLALNVAEGDEVITQAVTFVASCNAINYVGAVPVFIDIDADSLNMSPEKLQIFLHKNYVKINNQCFNKLTGNRLSACLVMHTFGHIGRIRIIRDICDEWGISLVEDCAESLGSCAHGQHSGSFGHIAAMSFNGNKIITTGGGGAVFTNIESLAHKVKHLATTAKVPDKFEYFHDVVGYNYRMPAINAAIGKAQMQKLPTFLNSKQKLYESYRKLCSDFEIDFFQPPSFSQSNNWLNAILLSNAFEKQMFLDGFAEKKILVRPLWKLMSDLPMYSECMRDDLTNSKALYDRLVNLPSSAPSLNW